MKNKGNTTLQWLVIIGLILLAIIMYNSVPTPKVNPAAKKDVNLAPKVQVRTWGDNSTTSTSINNSQ